MITLCTVCNKIYQARDFRQKSCSKNCQKVLKAGYSAKVHAKHRVSRNEKARQKRLSNKLKAVEYLGGCCEDCGGRYHPAVYDFHHKDPSQKDITVGNLLNWNWGVQKKELDKCALLCANCHRIRHHGDTFV